MYIYIYINIYVYIYIIKWLRECHDHDQQPAVTTYRVEWKSKRQPRVISAPDPPSTTQAATQVPRALRRVCAPSGGKMLGTPDIQFSHLNLAGMNEELLGWRIEVNPNKLAFGKDQSFCGTGGKWSGKLHMTCRLCWESHWIVWVLIMSATQSSPASTPQQVNPWLEWLAELNNKLPPFFVVPSDQHFRCVFRITSTERQIVHDCPVMLLYYSVQWCSPAPGLVCQVFRVWFPSSEFAITVIDPTRRADVEEQAACWRCGKSFCFHMLQFTQAPADQRHLWVLSSLLPVLLLKGTTSTVNSLWFSCALGAKIVPHWGFNVYNVPLLRVQF